MIVIPYMFVILYIDKGKEKTTQKEKKLFDKARKGVSATERMKNKKEMETEILKTWTIKLQQANAKKELMDVADFLQVNKMLLSHIVRKGANTPNQYGFDEAIAEVRSRISKEYKYAKPKTNKCADSYATNIRYLSNTSKSIPRNSKQTSINNSLLTQLMNDKQTQSIQPRQPPPPPPPPPMYQQKKQQQQSNSGLELYKKLQYLLHRQEEMNKKLNCRIDSLIGAFNRMGEEV